MLDRTDFESWQQRIRLYCLGKDNGENIMKSIKEGPFHMGTVSDVITGGTEGAVQQGDHYTDAKDIWENVKMILEGSELTKDDRESQLYDEFEHFRQIKGETIQGYYVRFTKLINDMRNIKMTMPRMQLNSKFVNNMLPEWSRFITEVKLNRDTLALVSDASEVLQQKTWIEVYPTHCLSHQSVQITSSSNKQVNLVRLPNARTKYGSSGKVVVQDVSRRYNGISRKTSFRETMQEEMVVSRNVGGEWSASTGMREQSLFLAQRRTYVTNVDDNVDDSPVED
ncbi:hypothetical protein Tco_1193163 [Tanacetum coccineum]